MRIGVDLDGVCYDFADSFRNYLKMTGLDERYKIAEGEPDKWYFYRDWGITDQEFVQYCHYGVDAGIVFGYGEPRDFAPGALSFMRQLGHTIHIITDRSFGSNPWSSVEVTKRWLKRYAMEYDTIDFSADKTIVPTDVFIEDKLENYDALVNAGVTCYLVDRPWNQDPGDSRTRIKSIQHFATIIGNLS